jgi:hypothetical protein
MIHIRDTAGKVTPIQEGAVVEFCDSKGRLAAFVMQEPGGAIRVVTPDDPRFNAHLMIVGGQAAKVTTHSNE